MRLDIHDEPSEQSVLGNCIDSAESYDEIQQILVEDDFWLFKHRALFRCISDLYERDGKVDVITLTAHYLAQPDIEDDGSALSWVKWIWNSSASFNSGLIYAETVRNHSIARRLHDAGMSIQKAASDTELDTQSKISKTSGILTPLLEQTSRADFVTARDASRDAVRALLARKDSGGMSGLSTNFGGFDAITGGLQDSDLIVLAGRPSMGKTCVALNIANHVSKTDPVLFFSLEMPTRALMNRMLSTSTMINLDDIRDGKVTESDEPRIEAALYQFEQQQLFIDDRGGVSVDQIRSRARMAKRKYGCRLVVIDYLTMIQSKGENQNLRVAAISSSLKNMAKELGCPVILLSQLSRSVDQRPNKRPIMSDLRDSGAIEQDADLVIFSYLDEKYNPDTHMQGIGELIIRKHRNGETGTVYLDFDGAHQKFTTRNQAIPLLPEKKNKNGYKYSKPKNEGVNFEQAVG